ncbi:hypothetical protein GJ496_003709 [Pomphorhynchus laevis]|nr:hypothetical protein GJ496_003709 [Pomphorhynchus laevis]
MVPNLINLIFVIQCSVPFISMDPIQKIVIPEFLPISEFRQPGYLIFDFNEFLKSIHKQESHTFKLVRKNNPLVSYIELSSTGKLSLRKTVDHEFMCIDKKACKCGQCIISLELTARSSNYHYLIIAKVQIEDNNDNVPIFPVNTHVLTISEDAPIATSVLHLLKAIDRDHIGPDIQYSLTTVNNSGDIPFTLEQLENSKSPILRLTKSLDRESNDQYLLILAACDTHIDKCSHLNINITVTDVNDEWPQILNCPESVINIYENVSMDTAIYQLNVIDPDQDDSIIYSLQGDDAYLFSIAKNGQISIKSMLRYKKKSHLNFEALAKDRNNHISRCRIRLNIIRIEFSEIALTFPKDLLLYQNATHYAIDIVKWYKRKSLQCLAETNADLVISMNVVNGSPFVTWRLHSVVNDETKYNLIAKPTSALSTSPNDIWTEISLKATSNLVKYQLNVIVLFTKPNLYSPTFKFNVNKAYMIASDTYKVDIQVIDKDLHNNVTVFVPAFNISKTAYPSKSSAVNVRLVSFQFPRHNKTSVASILAVDDGWPRRNSSQQLAVIQFPGKFYCKFDQPIYNFRVKENEHQFGPIRLFKQSLYEQIDYRFYPDDVPFTADQNSSSDEQIFFKTTSDLDREKKDVYRLTLHAIVKLIKDSSYQDVMLTTTDQLGYSGEGQWIVCADAQIELIIEDVNDNAPVILFPLQNEKVRIRLTKKCIVQCSLLTVEVHDPDLDFNGQIEYFLVNESALLPFTITNEGIIIYTGRNLSSQTFRLNVLVLDHGKPIRLNDSVQFHLDLLSAFEKSGEYEEPKISLWTTQRTAYTTIFAVGLLSIISIILTCLMFIKNKVDKFHRAPNSGDSQLSQNTSRLMQECRSDNDTYSAIKVLVDQATDNQTTTSASGETAITRTGSNNSTAMLVTSLRENIFNLNHSGLYVRDASLQSCRSNNYQRSLYPVPQWLRDCDKLKSTLI